MFSGRKLELGQLENLLKKQSASLVVVKGRRRIGKSRLIAEFAKKCRFIKIAGVAPTKQTTAQSERDHFASQMCQQLSMPSVTAKTWDALFHLLAENTREGRVVILLDEISWMGSKDADFLGQLKNAWDYEFSNNHKLMLILCGSVSTWITEEIMNSTVFLGRSSLNVTLKELSLKEALAFWSETYIAAYEKLKLLAVTGGVPRYLELINPKLPAEENIRNLLALPNSPLLYEFKNIFNDIFGKKSEVYREIVACLVLGAKTQKEVLNATGRAKSGDISDYLNDLVESGFISREYTFNLKSQKKSGLSSYRLRDNFLRFYLKYIADHVQEIEEGLYELVDLSALPGWHVMLGLQFENLVLNNVVLVIDQLGVAKSNIQFCGPYFQRPTKRAKGCQIDLLVCTRTNVLYVCEIKFSKHPIGKSIIPEMKEKIRRLSAPKYVSYIPVLIHVNGITEELEDKQYFPYVIDFDQLCGA